MTSYILILLRLSARKGWHNQISRYDLYPPNAGDIIDDVMTSLARDKITRVEDTGDAGTQIKWIVWLNDDFRAMVKPIRYCACAVADRCVRFNPLILHIAQSNLVSPKCYRGRRVNH